MARSFSFPHPVLGHSDDVVGEFEFAPSVSVRKETQESTWQFGGSFKLTNVALEEAVKEHRAVFQMRIICDRTYLRRSFRADPGAYEISGLEISSSDLWGMVRIQPLLVAADNIPEYLPSEVHSDYGGALFTVNASQILAVGTDYTFHIDDDYDPLQVPVDTILEVDGNSQSDLHEIDYAGEKILVSLPLEMYERYSILISRHTSIIISMIAAPAITEAIRRVRDPGSASEVSGTLWFSRLEEMLVAREDELARLEPDQVAEVLLKGQLGESDGYALSRAFTELDLLDQQGSTE